MSSTDYCGSLATVFHGWRHEPCRYMSSEEGDCAFHRAFANDDIDGMKRALFISNSAKLPAGLEVESVTRREDGSYIFTIVALPDEDDSDNVIADSGKGERARLAR